MSSEAELRAVDGAVESIFEAMFRLACTPAGEATGANVEISASISFAGSVQGRCTVGASRAAAARLTVELLGPSDTWDDAIFNDAVGELCNLIAGGWKSRLQAPFAACEMSAPLISRGSSPQAKAVSGRLYSFDGNTFEVDLEI